MAGEYIKAPTIAEYWQQLEKIYREQNLEFTPISEADYNAIKFSEREDSDNHFNEERLGKDSFVVDIAFYKYLENREVAYRVHIIDVEGQEEKHYFKVRLKE